MLPSIVRKITDKLGLSYTERVDPNLAKQLSQKGIYSIDGKVPSVENTRNALSNKKLQEEKQKQIQTNFTEKVKKPAIIVQKPSPIVKQHVQTKKTALSEISEKLKPKETTEEPSFNKGQKAIAKFGVTSLSLLTKSADFFVDLAQQTNDYLKKKTGKNIIEQKPLADSAIQIVKSKVKKLEEVSPMIKRWTNSINDVRNFIGLGDRNKDSLDKLDSFLDTIKQDPSLKPGEEWSKSLQEKGILKTASEKPVETLLELGPEVAASIVPYLVGGAEKKVAEIGVKTVPKVAKFIQSLKGSFIMGGSIADELKQDAMANNIPEKQATLSAIPVATGIALMDRMFGLGKNISDTVSSKLKKDLAKQSMEFVNKEATSWLKYGSKKVLSVLKEAGEEGFTERMQEKFQIWYEKKYKDVSKEEEEMRKAVSTFAGVIFGGGFKVYSDILMATTKRITEEKEETMTNKEKNNLLEERKQILSDLDAKAEENILTNTEKKQREILREIVDESEPKISIEQKKITDELGNTVERNDSGEVIRVTDNKGEVKYESDVDLSPAFQAKKTEEIDIKTPRQQEIQSEITAISDDLSRKAIDKKTANERIDNLQKEYEQDSKLLEKAREYEKFEDFLKSQEEKVGYRSSHQLDVSNSTTADKINIAEIKEIIRKLNGYINNTTLSDLRKLEKIQNNPNADVIIYRASPKNEINDGDWVTTNKTYANNIKEQNGGKVYTFKVRAGDLRYAYDIESLPSMARAAAFSYSPKTTKLKGIWDIAKKQKTDISGQKETKTTKDTISTEKAPQKSKFEEKQAVKDEDATAFKTKTREQRLNDVRSTLMENKAGLIRLQEYKNRIKADFDIVLIDKILTGRILDGKQEEAWGVSFENNIALSEWITKWTVDHEVVHYVWKNFDELPLFKDIDQSKVIEELKTKYQNNGEILTGQELEEALAEDYELFMENKWLESQGEKKRHTFTQEMAKLFEKLWNNILNFFKFGQDNKLSEINKFYELLSTAVTEEQQTGKSSKKAKYTITGNILQFQNMEAAAAQAINEKKEMPHTNQEFVKAEKTKKEILDDFLKNEKGQELKVKEELKAEKRSKINRAVIEGIKRNPYYQKERVLLDKMGEGYLLERMREGKMQYLVSTDVGYHSKYGWSKILEIDSLAQESGFEKGFDYLEDQLKIDEIVINADLRKEADKELRKTNEEYKKAVEIIDDVKEYLATIKIRPEKIVRMEAAIETMKQRQNIVSAIKDYFNLSDSQMRNVSRKDPRFMTDEEFETFALGLEQKAKEYAERLQAINELQNIISKKDLKKTEQVQSFLNYPTIDKMTTKQAQEFATFLDQYQTGDTFLTARQLETIEDTEIKDAKTERETLDILVKKTGMSLAELKEFRPEILDSILWDSALAEKNPFYKMMVDTINERIARNMLEFQNIKDTSYRLAKAARKSRRKKDGIKISNLLSPTDPLVFAWLDGNQEQKIEFAKEMTPEEMEYALFTQKTLSDFRDNLMANKVLEKYRENYITHMRKSFLETVMHDGIKKAFLNLFEQQKDEQANFNILNQATGDILAREKFFSFALQRSGKIDPTNNVAYALEQYSRAFYKKKAIDSFVGELDTYAKVLTPKKLTPQGLEMDRQLLEFTNKWLNTKKGRKAEVAFVRQGNKIDTMLRIYNGIITFRDLALNPFVQIASFAGEKASNWVMLGTKQYAIGAKRALTKKGKNIAEKYEQFVGETFWKQIMDPAKDAGDQISQLFYGGFDMSGRSSNIRFLLGLMTKTEYETETISPERLAELRRLMGRYRVVSGSESIYGATSVGKLSKKYLTWALPIARTTYTNLQTVLKMIKDKKNPIGTRETQELLRVSIIGALSLFIAYAGFSDVPDDEETPLQKLRRYIVRDGLSVIGAIDPTVFAKVPRAIQFISDIATSVGMIKSLDEKSREQGVKKLARTIKPQILNLVLSKKDEKTEPLSQSDLKTKQDEIIDAVIDGKITKKQGEQKLENLMTNEKAKTVRKQYDKATDKEVVDGILDRVIDGELTKEEAESQIKSLGKLNLVEINEASEEALKSRDSKSFVEKIIFYANAWKVDPISAFEAMLTKERIEKIENKTIIFERIIGSQESTKIKKDAGYSAEMIKTVKLDHIVPIQLGGDNYGWFNKQKNLQIVPTKIWETYTPVENYLGRKLRAGEISERQAQKLIKEFKSGKITAEDIMENENSNNNLYD